MFSRFLRTGFAVLGIAFSPLAAKATVYEAVWQVQIVSEDSSGLPLGYSRPTSFEYKVRFSDEVWSLPNQEDYPFDTIVYYDPNAIVHTRSFTDSLPARPEGGTRSAYNTFSALVADEEWEFSETVETAQIEIIRDGDLYWGHSTFLMSARYSEARSGVGEDDYPMTSEAMLFFLEEVMADPSAFKLEYFEHFSYSIGTVGLYSASWLGEMQLVSLRAIDKTDVPEPPLLALLGTGLVGIGLLGRRKRHLQKEVC